MHVCKCILCICIKESVFVHCMGGADTLKIPSMAHLKKGERIKQWQGKNEKSRGGKCQTRSCLVPACLAVMDGLQWEGNTSFKLAISTIYRADKEERGREDS